MGSANLENVDLTISRGVDVRGRLVVEGPAGVDPSQLRVRLAQQENIMSFSMPTDIKADGTFLINDVSEGVYKVLAVGRTEGMYVKAVRMGSQDVLKSGLTVGAGGPGGLLEIVVSTAGAVVEGVVTDEDGLLSAGATVALIPGEAPSAWSNFDKSTTTDQHGRFVIRDVRPGAYKAFAWKEVEWGEWNDPEFLKPFEEKGAKIEAEDNGHVTVQLKLLPSVPSPKTPQ